MAVAALNNISQEVAGAIERYFSILSHVGYKSYCEVDKLLVFIFIEELLNKFSFVLTEKDYDTLANVVNCFYGSCMIPFPYYIDSKKEEEELPVFFYEYFRLSEDNLLRATENNSLRLNI